MFAHAQRLGLHLHFKLQETEIDDRREGRERLPAAVPEALDGGSLGPERKVYLRELIARFGHHLALNWNLGEETHRRQTSSGRWRSSFMTRILTATELVGNPEHDNSRYCLALPGELYLVYLPQGGEATLDLSAADGVFSVSWFNPRAGGSPDPALEIRGGAPVSLRAPTVDDWLAVVRSRQQVMADGEKCE